MQKIVVLALLLATSMVYAKSMPAPDWVIDYRSVYPTTDYLAESGNGKTVELAKNNALSALAGYVKREVFVRSEADEYMAHTTKNGSSEMITERILMQNVSVTSDVELRSVEFTEPWYDKTHKTWFCVAYINRKIAWEQHESVIQGAQIAFHTVYEQAQKEVDSVSRCALYARAQDQGTALLSALDYGRLLLPAKEEKYERERAVIHSIPALAKTEQAKCTIYIVVTGDWGNMIATAVSSALMQGGFTVARNSGSAKYTAMVIVETNASGSDPLTVLPSVDIKIENTAHRTIYANQLQAENKTIAYTIETAQKKAFPPLAKKINTTVTGEVASLFAGQ